MAKVEPPKETDYIPPKNTGIGAINPNALLPGVTREVEAELSGQIAPIQADITGLTARQGRAETDIARLFGDLQPAVEGSAERLRGDTQDALNLERAIFGEAQNRLSALSQQRAADAQALAQQLGITVPLESLFRGQADFEGSMFANEAGTRLLSSSMMRDTSLGAAEAFAGRVFPLLRKEEEARTRNYFQDEITKRKAEIKAIKGTKKGLINAKLRERLIQDRQYKLDTATANRNWWLAVKGLELERDRINTELAKTDAELAQRGTELETTVAENARDRAQRERTRKAQEKLARDKLRLNGNDFRLKMKENIVAVINSAVSPGKDLATVTQAIPVEVGTPDAVNIGTIAQPRWVKYVKETRNFAPGAITNPNQLIDLVFSQLPITKKKNPKLYEYAVEILRNRLAAAGIKVPEDWKYGEALPGARPTTPYDPGRRND